MFEVDDLIIQQLLTIQGGTPLKCWGGVSNKEGLNILKNHKKHIIKINNIYV